MTLITDYIEEYFILNIGNDETLQLSRMDLGKSFNCRTSQINYVLSTRFIPS